MSIFRDKATRVARASALRWGAKAAELPESARWAGALRIGLRFAEAFGWDRCHQVAMMMDKDAGP